MRSEVLSFRLYIPLSKHQSGLYVYTSTYHLFVPIFQTLTKRIKKTILFSIKMRKQILFMTLRKHMRLSRQSTREQISLEINVAILCYIYICNNLYNKLNVCIITSEKLTLPLFISI